MYTSTDKQKGFSFIEVLVSVALFSIVAVIAVSTLLTLVDANRKAQTLQSVINNLNFALDGVARNLATGNTYYCDSAANIEILPAGTRDCANGDTGIVMTNDKRQRVGYRFVGSSIERRIDNNDWIDITAEEVFIQDMLFHVTGTTFGDGDQPSVTISVRGEATALRSSGSDFNIQTTITQRLLDD